MYHFDDKNSGISEAFVIENEYKEYEYFVNYLDEHMKTTIVDETNRYHEYSAEDVSAPKSKPWVPTNVNEMYCFFAIILSMPHIKKHKILDYWSTDPIIASNCGKYDPYLKNGIKNVQHFSTPFKSWSSTNP